MLRPEPRTLPSPEPVRIPRHHGVRDGTDRQQIHVHVNSLPQAPNVQSHIPQSDLDRLTSQEITDLRQVREYWQQARATLENAHERAGSPLQRSAAPLLHRSSSPTVALHHQPRGVRFQRPEYLVQPVSPPRPIRTIQASPPHPIRTLIAGRYPEVTLSANEMRRMNIPPTPELSSPSPILRRDHKRGKPPRGQRGAGNQAGGEGPGHQGHRATGPVTGRGSENVGSAIVLSGTRPRTPQRLPPPLTPRILRHQASASPDSPLSQSCLLYTSPSPRDLSTSRMPSSA